MTMLMALSLAFVLVFLVSLAFMYNVVNYLSQGLYLQVLCPLRVLSGYLLFVARALLVVSLVSKL